MFGVNRASIPTATSSDVGRSDWPIVLNAARARRRPGADARRSEESQASQTRRRGTVTSALGEAGSPTASVRRSAARR
jgi:hypothetical protein